MPPPQVLIPLLPNYQAVHMLRWEAGGEGRSRRRSGIWVVPEGGEVPEAAVR